jgi:hypothetical protein
MSMKAASLCSRWGAGEPIRSHWQPKLGLASPLAVPSNNWLGSVAGGRRGAGSLEDALSAAKPLICRKHLAVGFALLNPTYLRKRKKRPAG